MKNLLFLLADQFRFDALGAENPLVQTPHLDALAEAGARFTRAYTPLPVCAPARQALYTGRHPDSFGAYWNYGFFPTPPISPEGAWPRALKAMGYSCGFIGKWNVSPVDGPEAFGYDTVVSAAQYSDGGAQYTGGWLGCESPVPLEQAKPHWLADRAIEFIGAQRGPWHLFVDIGMPHLPCRPSAPFSRMYDPAAIPEWPGWNDTFENKPFAHEQQAWNWNLESMPWEEMAGQVARYYGMVSQIDDAIGRILRHIDLRDTLVVFTSDHGDMCGNHRMLDKHCTLYQDIVRVPLILAGPGIEAQVNDNLVSNCLDLPVTLASLLGFAPPEGAHGQSLFGPARKTITSSGNGQQFGMFNSRMITDGHLKYVWNLTDIDELYDLDADKGECHNLIREQYDSPALKALRADLYADLKAHGDPFIRHGWLDGQLLGERKHKPWRESQ